MTKPRKVLMIVENLSVPADPRVWHEARALSQRGLQVVIICPKGKQAHDHAAYDFREGIHIYRYTSYTQASGVLGYIQEYTIALIMTFWLSLKIWLKHGFDIIHVANPPDIFFLIGLFYRCYGKKFVFDQHDLASEMFRVRFKGRLKLLYKLSLFLERCSYRTAHLIITTNESQKQNALKLGHSTAGKVFVVRNGPDLARFAQTKAEQQLKRRKRHMLVYVGVMGPQDGVEYALYALHALVYKYSRHDILLTLVGDGDQVPQLKERVQHLQLDEYVHFTGWVSVPEMLRYIATADIDISPDPSNDLNDRSTMLKTMEYMAMGKPTVAFDLPETRYSAQDSALYATPNRVDDFAEQLITLLDNEKLRSEMGARARKRVEEVLCWERCKEQLWQAYEHLLDCVYSHLWP